VALLRDLKERFPGLHIHAFSPPEIVDFSNRFARPVAEILRILRDAGLDSLPGGGAEILSDRVRRLVSPRKATASQWIEVMRIAHALGLRSSATMMFGHAETLAERVETLRRLRDLQDQTRGFTAFACWGWQPDNTPAARRLQGAEACRRLDRRLRSGPVGAAEYLRTLAVSRLYLDNVANIQVSCVTLGPDVGQLAMQFGGNDWGGIMLEENVVREAGTVHSVRVEDLRRRSEELGYSLCRRNFFYELTE
jgi:cyclic dehypoxanthinyl futalosine synthase